MMSDILTLLIILACFGYALIYVNKLLFPTKPVYVPGTTAFDIIKDGWSRGFKVEQTVSELKASKYVVDDDSIIKIWILLDEEMESFFEAQERSSMDLLKRYSGRVKERQEFYDHT